MGSGCYKARRNSPLFLYYCITLSPHHYGESESQFYVPVTRILAINALPPRPPSAASPSPLVPSNGFSEMIQSRDDVTLGRRTSFFMSSAHWTMNINKSALNFCKCPMQTDMYCVYQAANAARQEVRRSLPGDQRGKGVSRPTAIGRAPGRGLTYLYVMSVMIHIIGFVARGSDCDATEFHCAPSVWSMELSLHFLFVRLQTTNSIDVSAFD